MDRSKGGGKHFGKERFNWRKAFGEERFNWTARLPRRPRRPEGGNHMEMKTFVEGKHLGAENIWGRKDLIGQPSLGGRRVKAFGGGKI